MSTPGRGDGVRRRLPADWAFATRLSYNAIIGELFRSFKTHRISIAAASQETLNEMIEYGFIDVGCCLSALRTQVMESCSRGPDYFPCVGATSLRMPRQCH